MCKTPELIQTQDGSYVDYVCDECKQRIVRQVSFSTEYAVTRDDRVICYACCGKLETRDMIETGHATLYFSFDQQPLFRRHAERSGILASRARYTGKISNWPNTMPIMRIRDVSHSNGWGFGGSYDVYHVWFTGPDGKLWIGRCAGDSQILRCRRLKRQK